MLLKDIQHGLQEIKGKGNSQFIEIEAIIMEEDSFLG